MDRSSELPNDTFYNVVSGFKGGNQSAWAAFRVQGLGPVGSPVKFARNKALITEFGNRFNVIWSYAVRVFVAWDSSSSTDANRGTLGGMMIPVKDFNFWDYNTSLFVEPEIATEIARISPDIDKNRMPLVNLLQTLGGAIKDTLGMQNAITGLSGASTKVVAAHMVVYASWRIAACVAKRVGRGRDGSGHTIVETSDLYYAVNWVCLSLRRALDALDPAVTDWTFDDAMGVLSEAFDKETLFSTGNEKFQNIWMQTAVCGTLGYFVNLGYPKLMNPSSPSSTLMLPGQSTLNATFDFTTVTQASIAEALFSKYMEMMVSGDGSEYLTRVPYVPLFMEQLADDLKAYKAFQSEWLPTDPTTAEKIQSTLFDLEVKYDQVICGPPDDQTLCARKGKDFYWDDDFKTCKKISDDPQAYCQYRHHKDPSVGPIWDPTTKSCVFPKPGPTPRETCNATAGFHWEGDDATGSCVPDTPPPDPDAEKKKCALLSDHHWDDATKTCVADTEEDKCNKRKAAGDPVDWDPISKTCKSTKPTPSGGGGGGGGGGGSGPALFIGILALLALFGRR
jgi:hypothetical protein